MAIPLGQPIDFNLLELLNATAQSLATAPPHKAGRFYFDSALGKLGISNGSVWSYLGEQQPFDTETAQDVVAAMFSASSAVTAVYNDSTGTITLAVGANSVTNASVAAGAAISGDKLVDGTTNKLLTATERTKLAGVATGATANQTDAYLIARGNATGTQTADTITDGTTSKMFTNAKDTKLAGIATGATLNATDAALRDRATHTGTQSADTILDGTNNKVLTNAKDSKLAGIAAAATANSTDAALRDRATHTGTQLAATISDLTASVDARISLIIDAAPGTLDTLNELAAALGDDPNFAATMTNNLALKANISSLKAVATSGLYSDLLGKPLYTQTIGDGVATSFVITHNFNTRAVIVDVTQSATPFATLIVEAQKTGVNTVTILFATAPAVGQYLVTVQA